MNTDRIARARAAIQDGELLVATAYLTPALDALESARGALREAAEGFEQIKANDHCRCGEDWECPRCAAERLLPIARAELDKEQG